MNYFQQPISEIIWDSKYRYCLRNEIIDETIQDTWARVAKAVASAESSELREHWEKKFYQILEGFQFLPGGRIIAGAGTEHQVTLFNCFVMPIKDDSLSGIFSAIKEGALTLQQGGGVGYDFSPLRPRGAIIKKTDAMSSGPVSFMRIWNAMCATMSSTGARRGAMMGILRCDHPDIEEFIQAKSDPHELRHFNVSVLITDAFIEAVNADADWPLVFPAPGIKKQPSETLRTVKAKELWEKIMKSAYSYAEPGVLFQDTINKSNTLYYCESISATNPCGEIPLPAYGACNLGALNLTQFVENPFFSDAKIDWDRLKEFASIATRFLDNVIDVSRYPLKTQKQQAQKTRRIGLGFTGLADMFVMMGIKYGSKASLDLAATLMKTISEVTWMTSIELAQEKGEFPSLNRDKYLQGQFVQSLPSYFQEAIKRNGIRNSHHNTLAPTGTISLLANNVSNGLEPIFSTNYDRTIRSATGELHKFAVTSYALQQWRDIVKDKSLPAEWVVSHALLPADHLNIQSAVQPYIDNAISKTINLPENFPFENLSDVYMKAYQLGLKGCTIFRPNHVTGSVLTSTDIEDDPDASCRI